ncbi:MAG TPA: outer membrane protein assembly factor BamD [Gemmatimonadaceae bacterium]|nr:outer membrane protein assembly factor BamD [Gemmatimonadaceae bacterium]
MLRHLRRIGSLTSPHVRAVLSAALSGLAAVGCSRGFQPQGIKPPERLYEATMREYQRKRWDNAVAGFERLTIDLPARDTLLPRAHYYLAKSHYNRKEYLLAAQSFGRVSESFPDDTLADDALFEAGASYQRLWRKPVLDAEYGQSALSTFQTLLALYPNSPLRSPAEQRIQTLEEWMATKDYETGLHYMRLKAFDSAIIYFKDVVRLYPQTARSRDAYLRLVQAYRTIHYREEATEACTAVRARFADDLEVRRTCGVDTASTGGSAKPTP